MSNRKKPVETLGIEGPSEKEVVGHEGSRSLGKHLSCSVEKHLLVFSEGLSVNESVGNE